VKERGRERAYALTLPFVFLTGTLLIFPGPLTPVGMVGVLGILGLRWAARGDPFPRTRLNPALLALLVMFAFGLATTGRRETAWIVASHLLAGILVFVTITDRARTRGQVVAATGTVVLLGAAFAFGAPFGAEWSGAQGFDFGALTRRYFPLLARPSNVNNVAGALEAAVPPALALIAAGVRPWRVVGALALAPLLVMLLLLQSRGAWLAVLMGLVVYATLYRRWVLPLVPVALLAGLWLNNAFGDPLPTQAIGGEARSVVTLGDRTAIWSEAVRLLAGSPVVGIGVNGFAAQGAPVVGSGTGVYELRGSHAHNLFLQVALDTGLVGLAAFLLMLGTAVAAGWRVYRGAGEGTTERALAIGLLAAFAVIATHGLFDMVFWGLKGGVFLWAMMALALALERVWEGQGGES
jgi:putative inorganic carbon (HCO3(-)) transporter